MSAQLYDLLFGGIEPLKAQGTMSFPTGDGSYLIYNPFDQKGDMLQVHENFAGGVDATDISGQVEFSTVPNHLGGENYYEGGLGGGMDGDYLGKTEPNVFGGENFKNPDGTVEFTSMPNTVN